MNGILVVDKPAQWTSNDVVCKLRGVLHTKRIGHGGTLDPMATGVLPVFVGRATRAVSFCENAVKEYRAVLVPGIVTDTQDTTGRILEQREQTVTLEQVEAVLGQFTGSIQQIPPMYSAIKVGGRKLYDLARKGIEVERKPRNITIHSLTAGLEEDGIILRVVCSKGTYIRTLCHDIGQALGCGAAMGSLRRTRAGSFTLETAHSLEDIIQSAQEGSVPWLLPTDSLFSDCPAVTADAAQEKRCRVGNDWACDLAEGQYRVYAGNGEFLMLGQVRDGRMTTVKNFFEV